MKKALTVFLSLLLAVSAVSSGDYDIVGVVGSDGVNGTVSITCDVWREQAFPVEVDMPYGGSVTTLAAFSYILSSRTSRLNVL